MIELKGKYNRDCKIFVDDLESEAYSIIYSILNERASENVPIRIMPDTHVGKDIVIGFTMPLTKSVNPNHIGVDIGCGMLSCKITKGFDTLNLKEVDEKIRKNIPMGFNVHNKNKTVLDYAALNTSIDMFIKKYNKKFATDFKSLSVDEDYINKLCKKIEINIRTFENSIGTLGGGNHFIEIGKDSNSDIWITIHSGSRNFGNMVCKYYANKAKTADSKSNNYAKELEEIKISVSNKNELPKVIEELKNKHDLGLNKKYISGKLMFDYCFDMVIAQFYADYNRLTMLSIIKDVLKIKTKETIMSIHNYIDFDDFFIRKGAIRSYKGEKMIIPFNMRDGILICEGKSNEDWNFSAPHGAGRVLSRSKAYESLDLEDFKNSMEGIYSTSVCRSTLDEAPAAYKDALFIENAIKPTVDIIDRIKPILNIKAM